jgi:S1-C subfamily serine protease
MFGRGRGVAVGLQVVDYAVESILSHGSVKRGFLGIRTQLVGLPDSLKKAAGVDQKQGLLVVGVESPGPAEQAGVLLGDTLLAIGENRIEDVDSLRSTLRSMKAGDPAVLTVVRGGVLQQVTVVLSAAG